MLLPSCRHISTPQPRRTAERQAGPQRLLLQRQHYTQRSRRCLAASAQSGNSIRARWCIDIRYGVKLEALSLLQEWVASVGSQAGLTASNCSIFSGAVGVPESRLELEVGFDSMAALEQFWASIPPQEHKAWSQRMQHHMIDGSPAWHIYRACPLSTDLPPASAQTEADSIIPKELPDLELGGSEGSNGLWTPDANIALDWKGDPIKINPGDRLPGL